MGGFTRDEAAIIRQKLRHWYRNNARDLPWRRTHDPYAILVSEFMLQQTTVAAVLPFFQRWMTRFPTVFDLARADEQTVLRYWQGLGYYSRARNLLLAARSIVSEYRGRFPTSPRELQALPGVGPYTAGAVAAFAFDLPCVVLDANIIRVLARLTNCTKPINTSACQQHLETVARSLLPTRDGRLHTSALMELGALICTARHPRCLMCPLRQHCAAVNPEQIPVKSNRKMSTEIVRAALLHLVSGGITLQLSEGPHWRGMWTLPLLDSEPKNRNLLHEEFYTVTRYRVTLRVFEGADQDLSKLKNCRTVNLDELENLPLAVPHRRAINRMISLERCGPFFPRSEQSHALMTVGTSI